MAIETSHDHAIGVISRQRTALFGLLQRHRRQPTIDVVDTESLAARPERRLAGESQEVGWFDWDAAIERASDDRLTGVARPPLEGFGGNQLTDGY